LILVLTVVVTSALSTAPRYYTMILPLLILTSLLLTTRLTERVPGGYADLILLAVLGTIVGMNIAKIVPLVREQHSVSLADNSSNFYKEYRHGKFLPVMTLADVVKEKVKPDEQIITPSATIVQYLSGRRVYM